MANYNKYINTFSGATDVAEWGAYITSEYAGFPNVAYLETSDMVKYRKTGTAKEAVGSIYYSDGSMTLPSENVDTTKTPIGVVVVPALNDSSVTFGYDTIIVNLKDENKAFSTTTAYLNLGFDGRENTALMAASGDTYPAASYCANYSTEGTSAGDWFLASSGETAYFLEGKIMGSGSGNITIINASLQKIRTALGNNAAQTIGSGTYTYTTSSAPNDTNYQYIVYNVYGGTTQSSSSRSNSIPTRAFCRV